MFTFYFVAEGPKLRRAILSRMRPERQERVLFVWEKAIEQTGGYFYSRLLLAVINGTGMYLVLRFNNVPFAAPLAIFEGIVSEFIPIVGTYIGGAVPILVAFLSSTSAGVWAAGYVVVYQQLENYFLSPRLTAKTMSLHPAVAFAAALIGGALGGLLFAFLALPVAGVIQASIVEWRRAYDVVDSDPDGIEIATGDGTGTGTPQATTRKLPPMSQPLVGVIMGSRSDWEVMKHACDTLQELGVECETRVVSAHRTPDAATEYARTAAERGLRLSDRRRGGRGAPRRGHGRQHAPAGARGADADQRAGRHGFPAVDRSDAGGHPRRHARRSARRGPPTPDCLRSRSSRCPIPDLSARLVAFREAQTSKILAHPDPSAD